MRANTELVFITGFAKSCIRVSLYLVFLTSITNLCAEANDPIASWSSPPVNISSPAASYTGIHTFHMAISGDGSTAIAVWQELDGAKIATARVDGNIAYWGAPVNIALGGSPKVAISADGKKAVVIGIGVSGVALSSGVINGSVSDWIAPCSIPGFAEGYDLGVALSSDGDRATAVWSYTETHPRDSFSIVPPWALEGHAVTASVIVKNGSIEWGLPQIFHDASTPKISLSDDGKIAILTWEGAVRELVGDYYVTYYTVNAAIGAIDGVKATWSTPKVVYSSSDIRYYGYNPYPAISGGGSLAVIIFRTSDAIKTISASLSDGAVPDWGQPSTLPILPGFNYSPSLNLSYDGSLATVVYGVGMGSVVEESEMIQSTSATITGNHADWGVPSIISKKPGASPTSSMSKNGSKIIAVWLEGDTENTEVKSAVGTINNNTSHWGDVTTLSGPDQGLDLPMIGLSSDGAKATAVWGKVTGGEYDKSTTLRSVSAEIFDDYPLSTAINGFGGIISIPSGINCGVACTARFPVGSTVSLIAQPDYGYAFAEWGGDCNSTGACTVTMSKSRFVTAKFIALPEYKVRIIQPTSGVVSSEPAGILCGGSNKQCASMFSSAKLTATPNPGYEFIRWNGCQSPEGNICYIKPTGKMTLNAVFKKLPKFKIKINKNILGSITSTPAGLNCPDKKKSCAVRFIKGTEVTLTPIPQSGRSFAGWSGACSGFDLCIIQMDGNKAVGALFQ